MYRKMAKYLLGIAFIAISSCGMNLSAQEKKTEYLYPPAPGHENKPVIFWAHYMPQVSWGFLHCGGHIGGNADTFPFYGQGGTREEMMYRAMKSALDSGINGFQFLTGVPKEAFAVAEKIKKDTGQNFYIAMEGCGMGDDVKKAADRMAKFANAHKGSPHVFSIDGKQVVFFYNQGKWSGKGGWQDSSGVPKARKLMKEKGVELVLVPTVGNFTKVLLDKEKDMYRCFAPFVKTDYGKEKYLKNTNWDGVTSLNGGANVRHDQLKAIKKMLSESNKPFLLVPSMRTMYDSSNRFWQAIHCRGLGVRLLRRDLKMWTEEGFRLFTFSTWNDVNETMLMPSSRNPWGLNDLIKYYHSLAATGKSPFKKPHFVISYEPEVLLGDQGFFQFLVLPETGCLSSDYVMNVKMKSIAGKELLSFGNLAQVDNEIHDDLAETRFDTTAIKDPYMVIVPYVTIKQIDKTSGASRVLYDDVRLAPIRIRYNKLHYYTPYTISMNHVDSKAKLNLEWESNPKPKKGSFLSNLFSSKEQQTTGPVISVKAGAIEKVGLTVKGDESFRRVNLSESCLGLGAFRADDVPGNQSTYFVRLSSALKKQTCTFAVSDGKVDEVYQAYWRLDKALYKFDKEKVEFKISDTNNVPIVVRVRGNENSKISLQLAGMDKPVMDMTIKELAEHPIRKTAEIGKSKVIVDIRLTTDATDPNLDYPLPKKGTFQRMLPIQKGHEALRVFHVWGLTKNDMVSYSNPIALVMPGNEKLRNVNYIETDGVFDDFVNDSSSLAENPFTSKDVKTAQLPTWMVPYFLIDFNEGCGTQINHHGTAHQLGRAWVSGKRTWIKDGWEESALKINDGALLLRSKTMPHGSLTLSMRVKFDDPKKERVLLEDADNWQMKLSGPLSLRINEEGRVIAHRVCSGENAFVKSLTPLKAGWNHIVVTYDLGKLSLYINGKLDNSETNIKPTYQRTHSTPKIGISKLSQDKDGKNLTFSGEIDQLEIIGAALNANEVEQIYKEGKWAK